MLGDAARVVLRPYTSEGEEEHTRANTVLQGRLNCRLGPFPLLFPQRRRGVVLALDQGRTLNVGERCGISERGQVVLAYLRDRLETGGQLDQLGFAECSSEKA